MLYAPRWGDNCRIPQAMSSSSPPRVQFVVSGKSIVLFLLALSLLGGGYYWYDQQQESQERQRHIQERFKAPPYFVNRGASIIRNCVRCLELSKLKPQPEWKVGPPSEIPATEQRWFLAVEDPPLPVTVSGVLMLPVHPAFQENPSFGFDQNRVELVLYQNLQHMPGIEQPQPPAPPIPQPPQSETPTADPPVPSEGQSEDAGAARLDATSPSTTIVPWQSVFVGNWKNIDSTTTSLTRLLITGDGDKLLVRAWTKCLPEECDWGTAMVDSQPATKHLLVVWNLKDAYHHIEVFLGEDGRLRVRLQTRYFDQANHVNTEVALYFTRSAVTP